MGKGKNKSTKQYMREVRSNRRRLKNNSKTMWTAVFLAGDFQEVAFFNTEEQANSLRKLGLTSTGKLTDDLKREIYGIDTFYGVSIYAPDTFPWDKYPSLLEY